MERDLRFESLLRFYFKPENKNYQLSAIKRAYRDFARTFPLGKESKDEREIKKTEIENYLLTELNYVQNYKFQNQNEFDTFHRELCEKIKFKWNKLSFGHIQKWVNMSLKYYVIIGNERINMIESNFIYFHLPIDGIVLEKIFDEKKYINRWSKINNYINYFEYQKKFREDFKGVTPIIYETKIFNQNGV